MASDLLSRPIESMPDFAGILREQETYGRSGEPDNFSDSINNNFDLLMVQSGLEVAPSVMLFFCLLGSMVLGGMVFVLQENLLTSALSAGIGAVAPIIAAIVIRERRKQKMMLQLPSMIDELARAAKTGRSVQQCWEIVANDTAEPLGGELKNCARRMRMGEDLPTAIGELPRRTGLVTLNILVTALSVHQQTGGDLVTVLNRLSETIRDRLLFLGRLRAATTGSRATAVLMLGLPVFIVMFFSFRDPDYVTKLLDSSFARNMTLFGIGMQIVGSIVIANILKNSQRS